MRAHGRSEAGLDLLARKVGSGDPENVEAQAARRYWPALMGAEFRRDRDETGTNAQLNYGYTLLRSLCARAVVAAGLHPTIGVHHAHRANAFALADDLMEPFRPLVDSLVLRLRERGHDALDADAKRALAALIAVDLPGESGVTTVAMAAERAAQTFCRRRCCRLGLAGATGSVGSGRFGQSGAGMISTLSGYQLMWVFVMFDLPVGSRAQSRAATKFREFLLDEGFEKSQFSVYARFVNGKEQVETCLRRIEAHMPAQGEVHVLSFTDRQYENIVRFSGRKKREKKKNPDQLALF